MSESETNYLEAKSWLDAFGDKAETYAREAMQRCLDKDDAKQSGKWLGILQAIEDLQQRESGGEVH